MHTKLEKMYSSLLLGSNFLALSQYHPFAVVSL